jgi:ParB family transcriptional regulator, chromosome partitioning protein
MQTDAQPVTAAPAPPPAAAPDQLDDGQLVWLPVANISPKPGHNPRRHFGDAQRLELEESVRGHGVIQPIVIRPVRKGRYEIIAGERRWRAAQAVGLDEIPALIRDVDDLTAREIALTENTKRADLAPSEEAQYARDFLSLVDGDREDAALRLGWSRSKLDQRLALLHCSPPVLDALDKRELTLAHGELFATLEPAMQEKALPRVLEGRITARQFKEQISAVSQPLDRAIFDKSGCQGCPHNSEVQRTLFEEHLDSGLCSNRTCYNGQTQAALGERQRELSEQYALVAIDTESPPDRRTVLEKTGPEGVGPQQFEQGCRACSKYGVVLLSQPGRTGETVHDVCFDLACHAEKREAYRELLTAPAAPKADPQKDAQPSRDTADTAAEQEAVGARPTPAEKPSPGATTKAAEALTDNVICAAAAELSAVDPAIRKAVQFYAIWSDAGFIDLGKIDPECAGIPMSRSAAMQALYGKDAQLLSRVAGALIAHILSAGGHRQVELESGARCAAGLIAASGADIASHFRLDGAFLKAHRKAGIEALLREAGFPAWYESSGDGKKKFAALVKGKVDEIIAEAMRQGGFDWSGFVPEVVRKRLKKLTPR